MLMHLRLYVIRCRRSAKLCASLNRSANIVLMVLSGVPVCELATRLKVWYWQNKFRHQGQSTDRVPNQAQTKYIERSFFDVTLNGSAATFVRPPAIPRFRDFAGSMHISVIPSSLSHDCTGVRLLCPSCLVVSSEAVL